MPKTAPKNVLYMSRWLPLALFYIYFNTTPWYTHGLRYWNHTWCVVGMN